MALPKFGIDHDFILAVKTSGKSKMVEDFNVLEEYIERFGEKPSSMKIINEDVDFFNMTKIRELLKIEFPESESLYTDNNYSLKNKSSASRKEIWLLCPGYLLLMNIDGADAFYYEPKDIIGVDSNSELCEYNSLIIPNSKSKLYDEKILNKIISIFEKSIVFEKRLPKIGMAAIDNGEMYVKDFSIGKPTRLKHLDLHYGEGFVDFNKKLVKILTKEKKGLILLHGETGTGKTHYIRYLLSKISGSKKSILYFPPSMVNLITEPNFINFINTWVNDNEKSCIVLIEDAEPLLVSRDSERNTGISNLLNLTDGLLNDIFGIQIIATFNTTLDELDNALLRPERLSARKEFRKLTKEKGLELAEKLKIDKSKIKKDMSLAEIYSIKKKSQTLLHNVDPPKKKLGF